MSQRHWSIGPSPLLVGIGITLLLVVITAVAAQTYVGTRWHGDIELYHAHAVALLDGRLAATPHLSWYPPLSIAPLALPLLASADPALYTFAFVLEMSLLAGLGALVASRIARHLKPPHRSAVVTFAGFTILSTFVIPTRFDIVPAVLMLGSLAAALTRRPFAAGSLLGAAAAIKLYPAVALPVLIAWYWIGTERRGTAMALTGFLFAAAVGLSLYLLFPPASPLDLLGFHAERGLHLESAAGSFVAALSMVGVMDRPEVVFTHFSFNLAGDGAAQALWITALLQSTALVLATIVAFITFFRGRNRPDLQPELLILGMAMLVLVLIITNRVLSAQYMVWLLPFIPFMHRPARAIGLAAAALSMVVFPLAYDALISLSPVAIGVLLARNVALVALLLVVVKRLWDRSSVPAPQEGTAAAGDEAFATRWAT